MFHFFLPVAKLLIKTNKKTSTTLIKMKTIAAALVASVFVSVHAQQDSPAVQNILEDKMKQGESFTAFFAPQSASSTATVSSSSAVLLSVGGGFVGNHMPGWIDPETDGSRFFDFPESQLGNAAYIPTWNIAANSFLRMWCTNDPKVQKCDVYVNLYKCNGCEAGLNSDFSDYLITNGWTPSQCGPKFISDAGEETHKFRTFRKQLANNQLERIEVDSNVKLMFVTMSADGVNCSDFPLDKCENPSRKQCKVINGECVDNWCPKTFQGPCFPPCGGGCHNCALNEAAFQ